MIRILTRIIVTAFALILVATIVPGIEIASVGSALAAALFLGILNVLVRPLLVLLTLPITILTLGIFIFVLNAGLFLFVASFVDGFSVSGFLVALLGSTIVSIISSAVNKLL